jgi:hypothetical protein
VFDRVMDVVEASGELVSLPGAAADEASYRAANEAILEEAERLARPGTPVAVVAWDGRSRGPEDLTAAFAGAARRRHWTVLEVLTV